MSMKLGVGSHDHILVRICGSWPNMISFAWCSLTSCGKRPGPFFPKVDQLRGHAKTISPRVTMRFANARARANSKKRWRMRASMRRVPPQLQLRAA